MAFRHAEHVMGTVFSFDVRDTDLTSAVLDPMLRRLHDIDACYSTYRPDSPISRLGRGELALPDAPPEIRMVLGDCERWRERTDGWFDVHAGGRLDPSGYVKGWAVAQVSCMLTAAGSSWHCVNGGGDILALGAEPDQTWTFGIVDPTDEQQLLATVTGASLAIATSGPAQRGEHILNPTTHSAASGALRSFSVIGRSIVECDVLATAGIAMGAGTQDWFADRPDVQTFGVRADGSTFNTPSSAPFQRDRNRRM
jgi:thiamine biosynthesis lipoprotein